ncbi:MAG: response regulator [Desulforegulaceae bacterium]|nr:response regulator [Desulforegulaceae bacterium]
MKYKLLIVDDDENILAGYKRHLRKEFNVYVAASGAEGLKLIDNEEPFQVIVSDLNMPDMDGFEFLSQVNKKSPLTICIMLTGFAELKASLKAFNEGYIFRFLTKPCKINILEQTIRQGIEKYNEKKEAQDNFHQIGKKNNRKKILVIDEDEEELHLISSALNNEKNIESVTAENIDIAEQILNILKINLILISSSHAKADDCSFLKKIKKNYPDINVAVTTWYESNSLKNALKPLGIDKVFEKPINFNNLCQIITEEFYSGPKGIIDGISISTFLQMIEMEEKTCTLKITQDDKQGTMYFKKGSLIDASFNEVIGKQAAYTIICWEKAEIEIEDYCHKNENIIETPLMNILMEAAKRKDHGEKNDSRIT